VKNYIYIYIYLLYKTMSISIAIAVEKLYFFNLGITVFAGPCLYSGAVSWL
jgi:hypothetical protein